MAKNGCVSIPGGSMYYVSFGRGAKKLIVLPGLSDGLATVRGKALLLEGPYKPYLSDYTVFLFSRRNDLPAGFTIRQMAEDQAAAISALGIGKSSVLGVSQGGMIAQLLAAEHPELIEKLVLAVTAPGANEMTRACVERWIRFAEAGDHRALMSDTAEHSYSPEKLRQYRKLYPVLGLVGRPSDYGRFLANARAILGFDAAAAIGKIAAPTLVIGGADDRIIGAEASRELAAGIPGAELYLYPGLGHAAYEEAGDFYTRVFRFLESGS